MPTAQFRTARFSSDKRPVANADPDHDGADSLAEFAYNTNPLIADAWPVGANGTNGLPAGK